MLGLAAAAAGKVVRSVDKQCVSALWPTRAWINNVFLPYGRPVGDHWMLNRTLCSKTQEGSAPKPKTSGSSFKVPGHKPSDWDKKFLIWTGRFKKVEDIPETVSFEMIDAARNKMRVKISYLMIALTILGCIIMVIAGKRAVARHESLTTQNMEKKARWKEEAAQSASAKP